MSSAGEITHSYADGRDLLILEFRGFDLEVLDGPDAGRREHFITRAVAVGGGESADFPLTDPTVSRHHCLIEATEQGFRLQDQGSRNGTRLGGCRIGWALLTPGTVFQVGATKIRFDVQRTADIHQATLARVMQFGQMLGMSPSMRELFAHLARVAGAEVPILIEAESGCGKELCAEAIHNASLRAGGPFEVIDCASMPENLIESELFGHVRGAFTGATDDHIGAFERARGGTLFLDELGELPQSLQPKLLRVLDSQTFKPVGADELRSTDVRIVAATNRDLTDMVDQGEFRLDLFHRLAVVHVRIPPLRERLEDIPLLFHHFVAELSTPGAPGPEITPDVITSLQSHPWPGNVRELRNVVNRALALDLSFANLALGQASVVPPRFMDSMPEAALPEEGLLPPYQPAKERLMSAWERLYCERILKRHGGNVSAAAREAGVHRKSLEYLLKKHDLKPRRS